MLRITSHGDRHKLPWSRACLFVWLGHLPKVTKLGILETVPKKMSQMFLIIAQFPLVFRQNWIKYTKLFRFQALKWGIVRFSTLSELRDIDKNMQKVFFRFYTCCKAFKQQVRCNQKGLQRLREFVFSETQLCAAESLNLCCQITNFQRIIMRLYNPLDI